MEKKIRILVSDLKVEGELNVSKTAQMIWEALPDDRSGDRFARDGLGRAVPQAVRGLAGSPT